MIINSQVLIKDLISQTDNLIANAIHLKDQSSAVLNFKPDNQSWSVLECLEHLNRYGDFYLPEIQKRIEKSEFHSVETFKSSWLGEYFAKSMMPKEQLNKMKTFKSMNPLGSKLDTAVIDTFLDQQGTMKKLLNEAKNINLVKTKTSISISNLVNLRLGDTFRVVIYHNQRHMDQAFRLVKYNR